MALVLDTRTVEPRERRDVFEAAIAATELAHNLYLTGDPTVVRHRVETWDLGEGMSLLRTRGSGFGIVRAKRHLYLPGPEQMAVALQLGAPAEWDSFVGLQTIKPGELQLVDQTTPLEYRYGGNGGVATLSIAYSTLGLSVDQVRTAIPHLAHSPIYGIFREDLGNVCAALDDSSDQAVNDSIASSLRSLTRATILSLTTDNPRSAVLSADDWGDVVRRQILYFVNAHLEDGALTEESVLLALGISAETFRQAWPETEPPFLEYVTQRRLEGVRAELQARLEPVKLPDSIWRRWGFSEFHAFRAEFRRMYGEDPEGWHPSKAV